MYVRVRFPSIVHKYYYSDSSKFNVKFALTYSFSIEFADVSFPDEQRVAESGSVSCFVQQVEELGLKTIHYR